jgi:hypothetical protein
MALSSTCRRQPFYCTHVATPRHTARYGSTCGLPRRHARTHGKPCITEKCRGIRSNVGLQARAIVQGMARADTARILTAPMCNRNMSTEQLERMVMATSCMEPSRRQFAVSPDWIRKIAPIKTNRQTCYSHAHSYSYDDEYKTPVLGVWVGGWLLTGHDETWSLTQTHKWKQIDHPSHDFRQLMCPLCFGYVQQNCCECQLVSRFKAYRRRPVDSHTNRASRKFLFCLHGLRLHVSCIP